MLADVANEEHTVIRAEPNKQRPYLISARKAGFIDKVKVLALWCEFRPGCAGKESLQGPSLNTGLAELACGP
jgi:hypothetical protein